MSTDEYVPSLEELLDHYEELSLTVSGDPEVAKGNRREAEKSLARVRRDAAREALDGLIDAWLGKYGTPETRDAGIAVRDYRETNYRLPEETP